MARLELTPEDANLLAEILKRYKQDIRMEIANTEDKEFREALVRREDFMEDLLARLGQ
jgi:uncharacterized UPF0160 family protein